MMMFEKEEHQLKEENIRLQRKLFLEMERREALSRQLSESESSLEMDEERYEVLFTRIFCYFVIAMLNIVLHACCDYFDVLHVKASRYKTSVKCCSNIL